MVLNRCSDWKPLVSSSVLMSPFVRGQVDTAKLESVNGNQSSSFENSRDAPEF
jgi:hypothetical protein